ncbi:MAG: transglutaminase-like domain-containing protein [Bacteroidales bacterium]|jgi:hypothetical protein
MKILKNKVARQLEDASVLRAAQTCILLLTSLLLFTSCSTFTQKQALEYLYEYMPLNDRAEQSREYFQQAVSQAFRTKDMPWGEAIPEDLFKHYVLPPRVNNEYLDNARQEFYQELYPRVKDLNMYDAVLEVNHWCREKVEYRPTDIRTSAPLQTVARGYGRCGEESVVAVSALRSIGIPARQVYAPRWSHTNDNHAWVEVWVDGRWYYLGACEPEPELDRGWFTDEASRAMLIHTFVPGDLRGNGDERRTSYGEEILSFNGLYTELNLLERYAPVKKAVVRVVDASGLPLEGVQVSFGLYNYAEFYPLAQRLTDGDGLTSLTTGLGTLFIEAYFEGELFAGGIEAAPSGIEAVPGGIEAVPGGIEAVPGGIEAVPGGIEAVPGGIEAVPGGIEAVPGGVEAVPGGQTHWYAAAPYPVPSLDTLTLVLDGDPRPVNGMEEYILTPPKATAFDDSLSTPSKARLDSLCAIDDSLRIARLKSLPPGHTSTFLNSIPAGSERETAARLVAMLNEKDFLEATPETLNDWLKGILRLKDVSDTTQFYWDYVMNPRIANEAPLPYRETLWKLLCEHGMQKPGHNPATLQAIDSIINALEMAPELNPRNFPVAPAATALYGIADETSREVLRVALNRTAGIPARTEASWRWRATHPDAKIQYTANQASAIFANKSGAPSPRCLRLHATPGPDGTFPAYDTDFTIQRWENGGYRTLGFGYESGGVTQEQLFNTDLTLPVGLYRIVYGIRADDGSVRVRLERKNLRDSEQETASEIFKIQ